MAIDLVVRNSLVTLVENPGLDYGCFSKGGGKPKIFCLINDQNLDLVSQLKGGKDDAKARLLM